METCGDGHIGTQCLGDDCDDHDVTRFPSNPEVCDALGHDEDCDDAIPAITPGALRCILTTPQILNDLETCTSAGMFLKATCAGAEQCRVQPNGTGVCL